MKADTGVDLSGSAFRAIKVADYTSVTLDKSDTNGVYIKNFDVETPSALVEPVLTALKEAQLITATESTATDGTTSTVYTDKATGKQLDASNPMLWVTENLAHQNSTAKPYSGTLRTFLDKLSAQPVFQKTALQGQGGLSYNEMEVDSTHKNIATADVMPGIYAIVNRQAPTLKNTDGTATYRTAIIAMNGTGVRDDTATVTKLGADGKDSDLGEVDYKAETVTAPTQTVKKESGDAHATDSNDGHSVAAQVGSVLDYTITTTIPDTTGYTQYLFNVNDTPSVGLTFDPASVEIKVTPKDGSASSTVTLKPTTKNSDGSVTAGDYYVEQDSSRKITFSLGNATADITKGDILTNSKFPIGATVTITYKMTLNPKTVARKYWTTKASIQYSNHPGTTTSTETTPSTSTTVYTGRAALLKTDMGKNPLSGTTFNIYGTSDGKGTPLSFVKVGSTYRPALSTDDPAKKTTTLTTNDPGQISISGLDGTYYLKETSSTINAPVMAETPFTVAVDLKNSSNTSVISTVKGISEKNQLADVDQQIAYQIDVYNAHNLAEMPKTGAVWLTIWIAAALLCAAGGFILLHSHRKANAR